MKIEVSRRLEPIGSIGEAWEMRQFARVVWSYDDSKSHIPYVTPISAPVGYVAGLLEADVNGQRVDFHDLDVALQVIGLTRADIERQIAAKG